MITRYASVVVRTSCKFLVPFAQVFALYVLFHGHESPGGGFQGGAILGASIILLRFTQPRSLSYKYASGDTALRLGALGVLVYAGTGLVALLFGQPFLDYSQLPLGLSVADTRSMGILIVEIGVAIAVTGVLVSIFDDLAPSPGEEVAPPPISEHDIEAPTSETRASEESRA